MPTDRPRLPGRRRRSASEANAATYAALVGLCVVGIGLIAMTSLVLPQVRGLILVIVGGLGFFAAHYLLWGRVLIRMIQQTSDEKQSPEP